MTEDSTDGIRERLQRTSEDALGKVAQELLENPLVSGAIAKAFDARERAGQAQEAAMGALNLPSAADLERLTRRVRSVAQRLEGIEDGVDRLDEKIARQTEAATTAGIAAIEARLDAIDEALRGVTAAVGKGGAAKRPAARKPAAKKPAAAKPAADDPVS